MSCKFWIELNDDNGLHEWCRACGHSVACCSGGNGCECGKVEEEVQINEQGGSSGREKIGSR